MPQQNATLYKIITVLLIGTVIGLSTIFLTPSKPDIPSELLGVIRANPTTLKPFSLVNQHNQEFTLEQLKDKPALIFFGYTSCPDVCPATLSTLNIFFNMLSKKQLTPDIQIIFVSVDPQRDTTDKLADYMNYFNSNFIAISGSNEEINKFARQFGAAYFIEQGASEENYLISHASSIFLVDPTGKLIAAFSPPHQPDILLDQYLNIEKVFDFK